MLKEHRDLIVWLCKYSSCTTPPNKEEWARFQNKIKDVATEFALETRDRRHAALRQPELPFSNIGIRGSVQLTGDEEALL